MSGQPCPICAKHRGVGTLQGPVLYEDGLVVASLRADGPTGYAFVETRRHVGGWDGLTADESAAVGRLTSVIARALTAELDAERVHSFVAGLGVDHLHQHLFVRPTGVPTDVPWWPPVPLRGPMDQAALALRLRVRLG